MYCKFAYVSTTPDVISIAQGERIYVVERINQDWWFVRKKITNQSGLVPSEAIVDLVTYTHYINQKIDEAMEELPTPEGNRCLLDSH